MLLSEMFPSKYLKASDLKGQNVEVVIDSITMEKVGQGGEAEMKHVVRFRGTDKIFPLNITNGNLIGESYGQDSDLWIGKTIQLRPEKTQMGSKMVNCIRTYGVAPAAPPSQPAPPPPDTTPAADVQDIDPPISDQPVGGADPSGGNIPF